MNFKFRSMCCCFFAALCLIHPLPSKAESSPSPSPQSLDLAAVTELPTVSERDHRDERILRAQQRLLELGYLNYRPTGYYLSMTEEAIKSFLSASNLEVHVPLDAVTVNALFAYNPARKKLNSRTRDLPNQPYTGEIFAIAWDSVRDLVQEGDSITIIDAASSLSYSMVCVEKHGHFEMQPASSADYQVFLRTFGGKARVEKRACIALIADTPYAASIDGLPRGETESASGMTGCVDLYFDQSVSGKLGLSDAEHARNIASLLEGK